MEKPHPAGSVTRYLDPQNIWNVRSKYYWNMWTVFVILGPPPLPHVHFQERRCRVQNKHHSDGSDIYHISLIIVLPLNCSHTGHHHQAPVERNIPCPWIVPAPCTCAIILVGVVQQSIIWSHESSSTSTCSETCWNRYLRSLSCTCTVQLNQVDLSLWSANFMFVLAESARNAVHTRTWKCCNNLIVYALVLFPPSNCIRMLAASEINSTHGKNSRKYGIQE